MATQGPGRMIAMPRPINEYRPREALDNIYQNPAAFTVIAVVAGCLPVVMAITAVLLP